MMYSEKFAAAIKCGRKVLREFNKDTVYVPFGSEYSIYLKNLNNRRALVSITIDGKSISDGVNFVVHPNSEVTIERFIKNGNFNEGNKFKFIERTAGVEAHRGVKAEDGLIRIEYWFEKETPKFDDWKPWVDPKPYKPWGRRDDDWKPLPRPWYGDSYTHGGCVGSFNDARGCDDATEDFYFGSGATNTTASAHSSSISGSSVRGLSANAASPQPEMMKLKSSTLNRTAKRPEVENDVGITAPGDVSNQKFYTADWFATEMQSYVMILRLLGETETGTPIVRPVSTRQKQKCTSCGHNNKMTAKFCSQCSTGLVIV